MKALSIIGAASGWGAQIRETAQGPDHLIEQGLVEHLRQAGLTADVAAMVYGATGDAARKPADSLPLVADHAARLATAVAATVRQRRLPVVLGGDHAIAAGTWSGVATALGAEGRLGLIWIDAHMDAHTPQTSPSGAYHGMPVASLLGYGVDEMRHILSQKPKISPRHLVLMGARSYEPEEAALLQKLGVAVYDMAAIRARGFAACWAEALDRVTNGTVGFGVSIDLDAFDPSEAPGVGSPETGGLSFTDVASSLNGLAQDDRLCGVEVTELNPQRDRDGRTAALALAVVSCFFQQHGRIGHDQPYHSKGKHVLCA